MKYKLLFILLVVAGSCKAQSFFSPLPKPGHAFDSHKIALASDSTMNSIRPVANVAAFTVPGSILMTGAGVSYQHLKYVPATGKWSCLWSVSAMGWAGASVDPSVNPGVTTLTYGLMLGLENNLIMVGPAINNGKILATVSIGVSLNN